MIISLEFLATSFLIINFDVNKDDQHYRDMKNYLFLIALMVMALSTAAQELPQFSPYNYDGWEYNNPNVELSTTDIASGNIALYVDSSNRALALTSPQFDCSGINSIEALVNWNTPTFYLSTFDLSRAALTMVIEDEGHNAIDSVTCVPTTPDVSTHKLTLTLAVPTGLSKARLRFISWQANVDSFGAVRKVSLTAATAPVDMLPGDLNGNGKLDISDVTALIDFILAGSELATQPAADVDGNGSISISDVTALIDSILSGNKNS